MSDQIPDMRPWIISAIMTERNRIIKRIKDQICFDAAESFDGRCDTHRGKCYELNQLIQKLEREKPVEVDKPDDGERP